MGILYKLSIIKISIFQKLLIGIIFTLFLNGFISYIAIHNIIRLSNSHEIQINDYKSENKLQNLKLVFSQIIMPSNDYLIHGDKIEINHFEKFQKIIKDQLNEIKKDTGNYSRQLFIKDIENRFNEIVFLSNEIFKAEAPLSNKMANSLMEQMDHIASIAIEDINKLIIVERIERDKKLIFDNRIVKKTTSLIIITSVALIFALLFGGFFYVKNITKPLKQLTELTKEISTGNLTFKSEIKPRNNDEIEVLSNLFQEMVDELNNSTVSRAYFNNILKRIADSVIITDIDGTIKIVNKSTLNLLEYSQKELIGQSISIILKTEPEFGFRHFERVTNIENEKETNVYRTYYTKSGLHVPVSFYKTYIIDRKNNVKGVLYIASKYDSKNNEDINHREREILNSKNLKTNIGIPLTSRELEIVKLITENYSNREISDKLFISVRTVETHRRNIMQKLHTSSVISLVHYAYQNKII